MCMRHIGEARGNETRQFMAKVEQTVCVYVENLIQPYRKLIKPQQDFKAVDVNREIVLYLKQNCVFCRL